MRRVKRSPISLRELEARRANARKSTGPRTLEGKVRVSLNRLQHGGRSARLEAFLRQGGADPRAFLALRKFIRLPGERVDPLQATVVNMWLKSPLPVGFLAGAGSSREPLNADHGHNGRRTVGSLLSVQKMASVMKGLSPDYGQVLTAMLFESLLPKLSGRKLRRVTFKASMSRQINELRILERFYPSPRPALGLGQELGHDPQCRQASRAFKASKLWKIKMIRNWGELSPSPRASSSSILFISKNLYSWPAGASTSETSQEFRASPG